MLVLLTGISHRRSTGFHIPCNMTFLSFIARSTFLCSTTKQSSSHNCPNDINDELDNFGNICAVFASADKSGDIGNCPFLVEVMIALFGSSTAGPLYGTTSFKICAS